MDLRIGFTHVPSGGGLGRRWTSVRCCATSPEKKVLVLGGTGRVGQSVCRELLRRADAENQPLDLWIGGRNTKVASELTAANDRLSFRRVDIRDRADLIAAMEGFDLVVHTAGPFQQKQKCEVLEAALEAGVNYQDVCDDVTHMKNAKKLSDAASAKNLTAAVCTGIYPGISNLMAVKAIQMLTDKPEELTYNYFTAGTGGAGPTILSTTFLLCAEDVTVFVDGKPRLEHPASDVQTIDFGSGVGKREAFLLNLPEVHSLEEVFQVPNVRARFGTAPDIWNVATRAMAYFVPRNLLENRELIARFSDTIDPVVRGVDALVGATTGMRVDARGVDGSKAAVLYGHDNLGECVGIAAAAFTFHMLYVGSLKPGVLFPEELLSDPEEREQVLASGVRTAFTWKSFVP